MSAAVKAAAFAAMVRVFLVLGHGHRPGDALLSGFSTLAFLTMVVGQPARASAAEREADAGLLLHRPRRLPAGGRGGAVRARARTTKTGVLGVTTLAAGATPDTAAALRGILFYLLAYTVTTVGAFGMLGALERREDEDARQRLGPGPLRGLAQRKPGWAFAMAVFMLSLGGIPPTVGFMGKLFIFRAAVDAGLVGLAIVGVLASAAGAYYYLRVVSTCTCGRRPRPARCPSGALRPSWRSR